MRIKLANQYKWIKQLREEDYKYVIMPKGSKKKFLATKAYKQKKDGNFYQKDIFDEYTLEKDEEWIPGKDARGVFIRIK